jgi:hypothetical protein
VARSCKGWQRLRIKRRRGCRSLRLFSRKEYWARSMGYQLCVVWLVIAPINQLQFARAKGIYLYVRLHYLEHCYHQ